MPYFADVEFLNIFRELTVEVAHAHHKLRPRAAWALVTVVDNFGLDDHTTRLIITLLFEWWRPKTDSCTIGSHCEIVDNIMDYLPPMWGRIDPRSRIRIGLEFASRV